MVVFIVEWYTEKDFGVYFFIVKLYILQLHVFSFLHNREGGMEPGRLPPPKHEQTPPHHKRSFVFHIAAPPRHIFWFHPCSTSQA